LPHQAIDLRLLQTAVSNQGFVKYLRFHLQLQRTLCVLEIAAAAAEGMKGWTRCWPSIGMRAKHFNGLGKCMSLTYLCDLGDNALTGKRVSNERHEARRSCHHVTPVSHSLDLYLEPIPDRRSELLRGSRRFVTAR